MCVIVYLLSRGLVYLVSRLSERRGRRQPPDIQNDTVVLAA